ncbi:MAG: MBL fold metallo-hydrolase [Candidatus Hydrogenedentota bacterium]
MDPVEPKPAVTCILCDADGRILMGRRNTSLRFMGGHHVFPGGRVDDEDTHVHVRNESDEDVARGIFAAVREMFEETGLLIVEGEQPAREILQTFRHELLASDRLLREFLDEHGLHIDGSRFETAGHWITPEPSPVRFDTQYFFCHHAEDFIYAEELIVGELTRLDWYHPAEARQRWHAGEIELSPPVSYTLHHLATVQHPYTLDLLNNREDRFSGQWERMELQRGVFVIPLETATILPATHTNCIVVGESEFIVIDPGSTDPEQNAYLKKQLDRLIALGGEMKAVVLTHSHPDHIGGVEFVQETYGVPLWAHEKCDEQIDLKVDRHIEDNEVIELPGDPGWRLVTHYTPGHDPGHLSFYEESTKLLLCGDMIANPGTIVVGESFGGNMNQFLASLERLMAIEEATRIVPSHGLSEPDPQAVLKKHRDHRLWRESKIKDAYDAGATTLAELLAAAYDDAPKAAMPIAEHALKAHLTRLEITLD